LYFAYTGLSIAASIDLLIKATFILTVSSLIDSASGLQEGPGTADGSMIGSITCADLTIGSPGVQRYYLFVFAHSSLACCLE